MDFVENTLGYNVDDEKLLGEKTDKDRCTYSWEKLYIPVFAERDFWKGTDFRKRNNYTIRYKNSDFKISGDMVFNFKENKCKRYEAILKKSYSGQELNKHLDMLEFCGKMKYSLLNFSLMPVTGGLNNFKGIGLDRFDKFIYHLSDYFSEAESGNLESAVYDHMIFSRTYGRKTNVRSKEESTEILKDELISFLDDFGKSICRYFAEMHGITNKLYIKELLEDGKKEIVEGEDVVRYMMKAKEYWQMKQALFISK